MTDPRFDRQVRFAPLGPAGQARIESARVLLVGCGALGGALAQTLARAGVGELRLVDRDVVDETNLARQVLFDQRHAAERVPKVTASAEALARIGGPTRVETRAVHLDAGNAAELAAGCELVLDGTDNLATRYLLNDLCVERGIPWVYGGVVGAEGRALLVLPGRGPCLRCLFPDPPPAGALPTCDTAGVILPAVAAVAALQAGLALRVLARGADDPELDPGLLVLDAWAGTARRVALARRADCPCCARGERPFLEAAAPAAEVLCGREAVQILPGGRRTGLAARGRSAPDPVATDLAAIGARLAGVARDVRTSGGLLRFCVEDLRITLFPDGRALVEGTREPLRARAVVDRCLGA